MNDSIAISEHSAPSAYSGGLCAMIGHEVEVRWYDDSWDPYPFHRLVAVDVDTGFICLGDDPDDANDVTWYDLRGIRSIRSMDGT